MYLQSCSLLRMRAELEKLLTVQASKAGQEGGQGAGVQARAGAYLAGMYEVVLQGLAVSAETSST